MADCRHIESRDRGYRVKERTMLSDDTREYENKYPDYVRGQRNEFIDNDTNKICDEFLKVLRSKADKMLRELKEAIVDLDKKETSVYTGATGVALAFYFAASRVDSEYLQLTVTLVERALQRINGRRISFLNGDAGPLAVGAVLYHQLGNNEKSADLTKRLQSYLTLVTAPDSEIPDELLYGRVGYLYAQLFVNKYIGSGTVDDASIKMVVQRVITSGQELSKKQGSSIPLVYEWHEKNYVGAAHGTVGILYMLLKAKEHVSNEDMGKLIRPTLDALLAIRFPTGNLPSSVGNNKDKLIHWCHGAPGAVHLFCLAYRIFKDEKYRKAAVDCGEVVWERGLLRKGCSLCHGTSGNGYTFLALYQLVTAQENYPEDQATKYLYRACAFADWCTNHRKHRNRLPDHPLSLFEGKSGVIYYFLDLLTPSDAKFPAFDV